jgi:hypothetical protein
MISLIAWTGTQYQMIQKAMIIGKIDANRHSAFTEMRKDTFSSLPNQVYFM